MRSESPIRSFPKLRGHSWAYNDPCSSGGYYNVLKKLAEIDETLSFFDRVSCSRSHLNSMEMIVRGEVDAAAVDSEVLRFKLRASPGLRERLRVLESWIPFPIQPVVLRSGLPLELKARLRAGLLAIGRRSGTPAVLAKFGLECFAPVTYKHYASKSTHCQNASAQ